MMYDPTKDRSVEAGWKRVCDEQVPTEDEQDRWGKVMLSVAVASAMLAILLEA